MHRQKESEEREYKTSLSMWREIVETVASFATLRGGVIHTGIDQEGNTVGIQVGKGTLEDLANKIKVNTDPTQFPSIEEKHLDGKTVIEIHVPESIEKSVYAFRVPYKRVGRTNQKLSSSEVRRLVESSLGISWDARRCDRTTLGDLSDESIRSFALRMREERSRDVDPTAPTDAILSKLGLIENEHLTNAAVLLFGTAPHAAFPQAQVRCARFLDTDGVEFIDMQVIGGDLFAQIDETYAFVQRHIQRSVQITGERPAREERWLYPLPAVREAIVNAICHREYGDPGNVQVRIFDDRLEVWNPGLLPEGLTIEALRTAHISIPRNPIIANCFFLSKYIEQWGTGTIRMIAACREARLPGPQFEERDLNFVVTLSAPRYTEEEFAKLGLNERQQAAVNYVREHSEITNRIYRELTGTSVAMASGELRELMELGFLVREGKGRSTRYILPGYSSDRLDL